MPFITGEKLFFTLDGVDYVASANIFMKNNLLLTAAHCVQDDNTGHLTENFVFERSYTGNVIKLRDTAGKKQKRFKKN